MINNKHKLHPADPAQRAQLLNSKEQGLYETRTAHKQTAAGQKLDPAGGHMTLKVASKFDTGDATVTTHTCAALVQEPAATAHGPKHGCVRMHVHGELDDEPTDSTSCAALAHKKKGYLLCCSAEQPLQASENEVLGCGCTQGTLLIISIHANQQGEAALSWQRQPAARQQQPRLRRTCCCCQLSRRVHLAGRVQGCSAACRSSHIAPSSSGRRPKGSWGSAQRERNACMRVHPKTHTKSIT